MTVAVSKAGQHETLAGTTVRMAREILAEWGLCESRGADEEGYYFLNEDAREFCICYNALGQNRVGLLECCRALAHRGLTLSLFLSTRTSALYVRNER
jgi:hypothetical protein